MFIQQFFINGLAHSSYLLGGEATCAIIDPGREIDVYLTAATAMEMKITHILETHLHADFISGHMDLAAATGASVYMPRSARCRFPHRAVATGDSFRIEDIHIEVRETPGHTPEHISYVVTDRSRGREPVAVFCGDTLFVGDVGRPDLFPGKAETLASQLYDSLHRQLLSLPDFCEVYPAHGAGSLCGRAIGAKRATTIGYERKYNAALQIAERAEFIRSLTSNMPAAPDHFSRCSAINGKGPELIRDLPAIVPLTPTAFSKAATRRNTLVLDVRRYDAFCGQHVPGAYHCDSQGNLALWSGWLLPPGQNILLVADTLAEAQAAGIVLRRVGHDLSCGWLSGGMMDWSASGLPTGHITLLSADELRLRLQARLDQSGGNEFTLIDVRTPGEFAAGHIETALNIPLPDLRTRSASLDPVAPVVLICASGQRSTMAAALLAQRGFTSIGNVAGGMTGYQAHLSATKEGRRF